MPDLRSGVPGDQGWLFVSYSHQDAGWAQRFEVLLKPLVRRQRLRVWRDSAIRTGDRWYTEIDRIIEQSRVALLLISADYLASDFIMEYELPALMRHGVQLAPILVGDSLWHMIPEIAQVQWLHDPLREGALALYADQPGQRDRRIRLACERLLELVPAASPATVLVPSSEHMIGDAAELATGTTYGTLSKVPILPPGYVVRDELSVLIEDILGVHAGGVVGLTGQPAGIGLHGIGGIGKTVLAAGLAQDDRIAARFPDGIYWVTVGEQPDLLALQLDLLRRLGGQHGTLLRTVSEATRRLQQIVAEQQVLIVVDDVWTDAAAHAFRITGPRGRLLYTSRDEQVIAAVGAAPHRVRVISAEIARKLAASIIGTSSTSLPRTADRAFSQVGRVPLAVALLSAAVRGGQSWNQVASQLDQGPDVFGDHPYANTFRAMQIGAASIPYKLWNSLVELAVFPSDTMVPAAVVARYWAHTQEYSPVQTQANLARLAEANLLRFENDAIAFHDLQHDYLLLHAPTLAVLHAELLAAYRRQLPSGGNDQWWHLPAQEPYIWERLIEHLGRAGDRRGLARTVTEPAYIAQRITAAGPHASETDLAVAARFLPDDQRVAWWQAWLARHAHLFSRRRC